MKSKQFLILIVIILAIVFFLRLKPTKDTDLSKSITSPIPDVSINYMPVQDPKIKEQLSTVFKNQYYQKVINRTANENKDCSFYPVNANDYQWIVENKLAFSGYSYLIGKNCNYGKAGDSAPFGGSFVIYVKTDISWKAIDTASDYPSVCSMFDKKYYQFDIVGNLGCK